MYLIWNTIAFNLHFFIMLSHQECKAWIAGCAFEPHEKAFVPSVKAFFLGTTALYYYLKEGVFILMVQYFE